MRKHQLYFVISILFLQTTGSYVSTKGQYPELTFSKTSNDVHNSISVSGWLVYWDQETGFKTFRDNVRFFGSISPFWYKVDENGEITSFPNEGDEDIISFAHSKNVKVVPTIANSPRGPNIISKIINKQELRDRHIENIVDKIVSLNYDGVDINYESLYEEDREVFSKFISDLSDELHSRDKLLIVTVSSKTSTLGSWNGPRAQDWEVIGNKADKIRIMAYGRHWRLGEAGPIAPLWWVEKVITYAVSTIPREKIVLGIPCYGYDWSLNSISARALTFKEVMLISKEYKVAIQWDETSKSPWFKYIGEEGENHTVWFENGRSIALKIDLAMKYDIGEICFWRLGNEDNAIWGKSLNKYANEIGSYARV